MAYTALEDMRRLNAQRVGRDVGPMPPPLYCAEKHPNDLKSSALRFLHERCTGLRFDPAVDEAEKAEGKFLGRSMKTGQIPYAMQMDIDRLCLEKELEVFIDSGLAEDAYTVYYCYLEMFMGAYGKSKKMIELLSEYEMNGSSLLMKHRDHYSHSVYVFALGLAVYENNAFYRDCFQKKYAVSDEREAACLFLEYWGLTSLFHDIGYPFELPFEQVASYFESSGAGRENVPFIAYRNMASFTAMDEDTAAHFQALYARSFHSTNELFAFVLSRDLGERYGVSEEYLLDVLDHKPTNPERFGYFMDHGFFSATRLYLELLNTLGVGQITPAHVDALTAILLHNSLYKFVIADNYRSGKKPAFSAEIHPLAFLLMLCDELQCWDRTAYGRQSRKELPPVNALFDFSREQIRVSYIYDRDAAPAIKAFKDSYALWVAGGKEGKPPRLKEYSDMVGRNNKFAADIRMIVDLKSIKLTVSARERKISNANKHTYLSSSSFLHLYDFALAIHARKKYMGHEEDAPLDEAARSFDALSLEYKLSGLNRAKSFGKYLHAIQCFYTDKPVDFSSLRAFTPAQLERIAPLEHERWLTDHRKTGWVQGSAYETFGEEKGLSGDEVRALREQMRCHTLMMDGPLTPARVQEHYDALPENEKEKDTNAMNSMLRLLKFHEGAKIYSLRGGAGARRA